MSQILVLIYCKNNKKKIAMQKLAKFKINIKKNYGYKKKVIKIS